MIKNMSIWYESTTHQNKWQGSAKVISQEYKIKPRAKEQDIESRSQNTCRTQNLLYISIVTWWVENRSMFSACTCLGALVECVCRDRFKGAETWQILIWELRKI